MLVVVGKVVLDVDVVVVVVVGEEVVVLVVEGIVVLDGKVVVVVVVGEVVVGLVVVVVVVVVVEDVDVDVVVVGTGKYSLSRHVIVICGTKEAPLPPPVAGTKLGSQYFGASSDPSGQSIE